ncbi:hypothetical protein [Aliidiomarina haloalkalitolerans]|uniref:hypothetical protein n=1 Tax=Aliidiomarina haloalkalitolerans TaxID=859059 RepID=UPI000F8941CF|nr:hypothetical protein [Aliidiomarina haloalkalitolerans]
MDLLQEAQSPLRLEPQQIQSLLCLYAGKILSVTEVDMRLFVELAGWISALSFVVFVVTVVLAFIRRQVLKKKIKEYGLPQFEKRFVPSMSELNSENAMNEVRFFIFGKWDGIEDSTLRHQLAHHRWLEFAYICAYLSTIVFFIIYLYANGLLAN